MRKIIFLLLSVFFCSLLLSQEAQHNKLRHELNFSLNKHNSLYGYYNIYQNYIGTTAGYSYLLNNKFQLISEYNYSFMRNEKISTNASEHALFFGINYFFLNKPKIRLSFSAGSGFEIIYLKTKIEDIKFQYVSWGIPFFSGLKAEYPINDKINIYAHAKTWYAFMDIEKIPFSFTKSKFVYYPILFFTYGLGISYVF